MKTVERSALLPFPPEQVFDVVNDVASYELFLPWCEKSEVLEQADDSLTGRLTLSRGGIKQRFTTRNEFISGERINLHLVDGPFSTLKGRWLFTPLGDEGCKVEMKLTFDFDSQLANLILGKVFEQAADTMVDAFCTRTRQLHGGR